MPKHQRNHLLLNPDSPYPYGVIAGPSVGAWDELHGPFASEDAAVGYGKRLLREYEDYKYARIVKIETPQTANATLTRADHMAEIG